MIPRSCWLAAGAAAAALAGTGEGGPPVAAGLVAGAMLGAAVALAGAGRRAGAIRLAAAALGALAILVRLATFGAPPTATSGQLPGGDGPWTGTVVTLGSPRDAEQRPTLALDGSPDLRVAASVPRYPPLTVDDRVRVEGAITAPPDSAYGLYLVRNGIAGTLRSRTLALVGGGDGPAGAVEALRAAAGDALARALPEPAAGLAAGILVGLRERVDRDLAAAFTTTGLSHVVAISGWNIALVAAAVGALLTSRGRRARTAGVLVAVVGYTIFAGASPSVVRAAVMAAVALVARAAGRPGTAATALGWAVALILLAAPATVLDPGFRLSAAATAGLLAWSTPIGECLRARVPRLPGWLVEGLAVSLAAQAATLPIVLLEFGRLAPLSPLLNLAVVPLVPPAMVGGLVALLGGTLAALGAPTALAALLGLPGALVLDGIVLVVRVGAGLPLAGLTLEPPLDAAAAGIAAGGLIAVAARRRVRTAVERWLGWLGPGGRRSGRQGTSGRRSSSSWRPASRPRSRAAGPGAAGRTSPSSAGGRAGPQPASLRAMRVVAVALALALASLVVAAATRPDGRTHVVVLDVGQGDAILVETGRGGRLLVDGGPDPDRLLVALDARFPPWDRRLDLVVLTHPHEDHVAGLPLLLERYAVRRVVEPGMRGRGPGYAAWEATLAARGLRSERLFAGDAFRLDEVRFRVLWPDRGSVPVDPPDDGSGTNNVSIVLLGEVDGRRFLLTGDIEEGVDPVIVGRGLPRVDLLKVAHHGSRTASTAAFLDAVRPLVAVVSVGEANPFGHPAAATLRRIEAVGARLYRTDRDGTVDAAFGPAGFEVRVERAGSAGTGSAGQRGSAAATSAAWHAPARPPAGPVYPAAARVAPGLPYHRRDGRSRARRRRRSPPVPRPAVVASPPFAGRRGGRRRARGQDRGPRDADRPPARRSSGAPPRRGQGPPGRRPGPRPGPRDRLRRLARCARPPGARRGRRLPPGHAPPRRGCGGRLAQERHPGGARRRLRGQAGQPAPRIDGRPLRVVAAPPSGGDPQRRRGQPQGRPRGQPQARRRARLVGQGQRGRPRTGGPAGAQRVRGSRDRPGPGAPAGLDRSGAPCGASTAGRPVIAAPAPLGYYWGDDGHGLEAAAAELARRVAGPDGPALARWRTTGATTRVAEIAERVATATLFGGGTIVVVEDPGPLLRAADEREALLATLSAVAPGNALAFLEPVDGSSRRAASLDALRDAVRAAGGEVRQLVAPKEGAMARWIEERARERGIALAPGAAELLARKIGAFVREGDVDRRRQGQLAIAELEKLALFRLEGPIRREDVDALVADAVPGSTWALLDAVGERRARDAAALVERVLDATPEPVVLAVLHRRVRDLLLLADGRSRGETLPALARAMKLKEYPAKKLWAQAAAWTVEELEGALEGLLELDTALKRKGGAPARHRLAFDLWLAERVARPR